MFSSPSPPGCVCLDRPSWLSDMRAAREIAAARGIQMCNSLSLSLSSPFFSLSLPVLSLVVTVSLAVTDSSVYSTRVSGGRKSHEGSLVRTVMLVVVVVAVVVVVVVVNGDDGHGYHGTRRERRLCHTCYTYAEITVATCPYLQRHRWQRACVRGRLGLVTSARTALDDRICNSRFWIDRHEKKKFPFAIVEKYWQLQRI